MKTTIINFFAGPGAGKSSTAYVLAGMMKWRGISCELATEYAKDLVWQNSLEVLQNQVYVFGKQYQKMFRLNTKVEYIITDSPLMLSIHYDKGNTKDFDKVVFGVVNNFDNINFFIEREKPYVAAGRLQTEEEAKKIDAEIKEMLVRYEQPFLSIPGHETNWEDILQHILKRGNT